MSRRPCSIAAARRPPPSRSIDLTAMLLRMEPSLRLAVGPEVALTIRPADGNALVSADVATLDTIVRRLVDGTARAIPAGGELMLSIGWWDCLSGGWPYDGIPPRRHVRLTVAGAHANARKTPGGALSSHRPASRGPGRDSIAAMASRLDAFLIVEHGDDQGTRVHFCIPAAFGSPDR